MVVPWAPSPGVSLLPLVHSFRGLLCSPFIRAGTFVALGFWHLPSPWNVLALPGVQLASLYACHLALWWTGGCQKDLLGAAFEAVLVFSHWPDPSVSGFLSLMSSWDVFLWHSF